MVNFRYVLFLLFPIFCVHAQYGHEELVNGNFTNWTGDNPNGWALHFTEDVDDYVTENPSGQCQHISTNGSTRIRQYPNWNNGKEYRLIYDFKLVAAGSIKMGYTSNYNEIVLSDNTTGIDTVSFTLPGDAGTYFYGIMRNANPTNITYDNISIRQKLDTLYISTSGDDNNLGDIGNPLKTIAEALTRGFYDNGVFAFRSGDTFNEIFTAGNNTIRTVYGGSNKVTISAIDANGYTVTQSALINPVASQHNFGGFTKGVKWSGW